MAMRSSEAMAEDQQAVFNYVTDCLETVGEDSLVVFGKEGRLSHVSLYGPLNVERYLVHGSSYVPSAAEAEIDLANYVDTHLELCIANFESFPLLDFVGVSAPDTKVSVNTETVSFDLHYPITFEKEHVSYNLDKFTTTIEVPLDLYLSQAEHFVLYYDQHGAIDASYELYNGEYLEVHQHNETLILALFDNGTYVAGSNYMLAFALS
jgi:hypothetical protein